MKPNNFEKYHLAENANIVTDKIPGKKSIRLLEMQSKLEGSIVSYPKKMPIAIKRAKGAFIEDVDGNQFIDFFSGCGVVNVGHCNPDVLERVRQQQEDLIHALDFPTENKLELVNRILDELPTEQRDQFKISFCGPTGSDAIEAAIKLAKHKTGRTGIIAFHGSYHGMTSGALAVTSNNELKQKVNSLIPNVHFIPYSYCYRCPFGDQHASCKMQCAKYLDYVLSNPHGGIPKPAAILLEPIQGEGGSVVPKEGFLDEVIAIARKHDVLVIFDEVQSGFFRTGKFMASQYANNLPDIFTLSKGLGGIGFPISAIIYNKNIEAWKTGDHIGTFRGNQVSIAAGNAAMEFVKENHVQEHTLEMSHYLMQQLTSLKEESAFIGEVRGKGLFIGIEFVKSKVRKEPFPEIINPLREKCLQKGLLFEIGGHYNNVVRFVPPLIINTEIIDNAMEIFQKSLHEVEEEFMSLYYEKDLKVVNSL